MSEMSWKILLEDDTSGGGETAAGGTTAGQAQNQQAAQQSQKAAAEETKRAAPVWAQVGKFIAPLVGVAGVLAFVIQMVRRSKVFSTFMDSFLMVLSSVVDILMIPLIPLLAPVLKLMLNLIPIAMAVSKDISKFLKDPWSGIKNLFADLTKLPETIGNFLKKIFDSLGLGGLGNIASGFGTMLSTILKNIEPAFNTMIDSIHTIWSNKTTSFWDKILATAGAIGTFFKTIGDNFNIDIIMPIKTFWDATMIPILNKMGPLGVAIGKAGDNLLAIWGDPNTTFFTKIGDSWGAIAKPVGDALSTLWDNFYNTTLVPKWTDFWDNKAYPKIVEVWDNIKNWAVGVWDKFYAGTLVPLWTAFITIAGTIFSALGKDISANFNWLTTQALPVYWKYLTDLIGVEWHNMMGNLGKDLLVGILTVFGFIGQSIIRAAALGVADIIVIFGNGILVLINSGISLINKALSWLHIPQIKETSLFDVSQINKNINEGIDADIGKMGDIMSNVETLLSGITPNVKQLPDMPTILSPGQTPVAGKNQIVAPPGWSDVSGAFKDISTMVTAANKVISNNKDSIDNLIDAQTKAKDTLDDATITYNVDKTALDNITAAYKTGKATADDVTKAQTALQTATANVTKAQNDYQTATDAVTTATNNFQRQLQLSLSAVSDSNGNLVDSSGAVSASFEALQISTMGLSAYFASMSQGTTVLQKVSNSAVDNAATLAAIMAAHGVSSNVPTKVAVPQLPTTSTQAPIDVNAPIYSGYGAFGGPSFAEGIENVPKDMLAMIHKGERIIPASMNKTNNTYSKPITVNNVYNITSGSEDTFTKVKSAADQSLKFNKMRGYV